MWRELLAMSMIDENVVAKAQTQTCPGRRFRLCLITPGHLSTNPRLVKEADALHAEGYHVCVLACDYSSWGKAADRAFASRPWKIVEPVSYGPHAPMLRRLKQGLRLSAARGWGARRSCSDTMLCAAWHPAAPDLARAAARISADLYIAHYPAALPAAAAAARLHGGLYAFDAEDFHLGDPPEQPEFDLQRCLTREIEGRWLSGAVYVTAASPDIADAYAESYHIAQPTVLLNVFPRTEAPEAPTERGDARPGPSVYWFSQTMGPDRGLECAVRAISVAKSRPHLYLRGTPAMGYDARLDGLARSLGCRERLHLLEPAAPSEMVRLAAQYDLGLASEVDHTPARKCALTNKLFTYLLAGVPAAVSDTPAQVRFASGKDACLSLYPHADPQMLAAALDAFLLNGGRLAWARRAAFDLGRTRYNWEIEQRVLLDVVGRAVAERGKRRSQTSCTSP